MGALTVAREGGVAVVTFDLPGESVNKFSRKVKDEFAKTMTTLRTDQSVKAVVLISGKPENFIAGADIEEFVAAKSEDEFRTLSREGQQFLDALEAFPTPIVVAIHGACLGGGLEISLACHWRIATNHPKTVLGAPEVQIGIIPGAGGCNRLPRLVGLRAALDMILTGKNIRADKAFRMGLVDELVAPPILREVAVQAANRLAARGVPLRKPRGSWLLDRSAPGRWLVISQARKMTLKKTGGRYPAPLTALDAVSYSLSHGMKDGLVREADLFAKMAMTDVSRRLVEIFFATTAMKKDPGVAVPAPQPRQVERLGILGAGFMGAGIAVTAADQAGVSVRLGDVARIQVRDPDRLAYVTQTTLSVDETRDVIAALNARFPTIIGPNVKDICYATQNRQQAARTLATQVDLLLVVGAKNSSNSNRLREIGTETGVPSYLIDDAGGLKPEWLDGVRTIGVTAGASAPEALV
ncbi:MAG: enoyl-CoA hydratase-related protein, partial [Gemmatimonadota bacterium]